MEPITLGLAAASILPSVFGAFGGDDSSKYSQQAIDELIRIKIPDPGLQKLALEHYQSTGQLIPELENAIQADPSAFERVIQNQKYAQARDRALSQLQSLGEEGGLNLSDKADLQEQMIANANKDRANRDAITDDMARRGQLGSGMALQAQLQGAQSAGDRDAMSRLRTLGGAQDRALQAIMGGGELAGQLGQQQYQRDSDAASARDRINMFNTQNAQNVQQRNVGARNSAQAANLENQQKIANANVDISNQQQQYNKNLYQQQFENQMQRANSLANAYQGAGNQSQQAAAQKRQALGSVGAGVGQLATSYQNQSNWDKLFKKEKGLV